MTDTSLIAHLFSLLRNSKQSVSRFTFQRNIFQKLLGLREIGWRCTHTARPGNTRCHPHQYRHDLVNSLPTSVTKDGHVRMPNFNNTIARALSDSSYIASKTGEKLWHQRADVTLHLRRHLIAENLSLLHLRLRRQNDRTSEKFFSLTKKNKRQSSQRAVSKAEKITFAIRATHIRAAD